MIRHRRIFQRTPQNGIPPAFSILDPNSIYSGLTYTQSGNLTYFDSTGTLQTAAVNTMVLDYDPSTLALRGYPFWDNRTNQLLWCRDLTNVVWVKTTMTAAKTATGIDGTANSASTITATGASATILQTIGSGSAARATGAYVKRRTGTGTIEMTQDGTTYTDITALINSSTWTRVGPATATLANPIVGFRITTSGDAIDVDYSGCEQGSFLTAAILTTTASVTRALFSATVTGANFTSWYNALEGTFVCGAIPANDITGVANQPRAFSVNDNSTNNTIDLSRVIASQQVRATVSVAGVQQFNSLTTSWLINTYKKTAIAYKLNDFAAALGGSTVVTDASGTIPVVDRLRIGDFIGSSPWNGWIRDVAYYPQRLPNATVQTLST